MEYCKSELTPFSVLQEIVQHERQRTRDLADVPNIKDLYYYVTGSYYKHM